jgi:hypothetical protein
MSKLRAKSRTSGRLFAPLIYRLALRLEQTSWDEFTGSASEAVFVLRSAQRLFKLDAVCAGFDTWVEAEALGTQVTRDDLGHVTGVASRPDMSTVPARIVQSDAIATNIDIVRRLAMDAVPVVVGMSFAATLLARLIGEARLSPVLQAIRDDALHGEEAELIAYARQVTIALATAYLEAGASALLLIQEHNTPDLFELPAFASIFNLAAYYDVAAIPICRNPVSAQGRAALNALSTGLYLTPEQCGSDIAVAADAGHANGAAWLCTTRWEADPATDPGAVDRWRRDFVGS